MTSSVLLDPESGCITFGGQVIPLASKLTELAPFFDRVEVQAHVEGKIVPCVIASGVLDECGVKFNLGLRYEKNRLVSASLTVWPKQFQDLQDDAFYESVDARYSYHEKWMADRGMPAGGYTAMPWGVVGVGRDKSENVFIFLDIKK
jgi:hypothetical protein